MAICLPIGKCYAFVVSFLLKYVIFWCFVENNLIIACINQIKGISLYQQKGNKTTLKNKSHVRFKHNFKRRFRKRIDFIRRFI